MVKLINTKNYGKVVAYLNDKNKIGNGYVVNTIKNLKSITGFVDLNGKEIIPFQEMKFINFFNTKNFSDLVLSFKYRNCDTLEYYHIRKNLFNSYKLICKTDPFIDEPLVIEQVENNKDYWLIKKEKEKPEYAVYLIKEGRMITNFFNEITILEKEDYPHAIYYCEDLCDDIEIDDLVFERIFHTSICGYLDKYGNFSSKILDTDKQILYDPSKYGTNTLSKEFTNLVALISQKCLQDYHQKEEEFSEIVDYLYSNPIEIRNDEVKTKVLKFDPDRKKV